MISVKIIIIFIFICLICILLFTRKNKGTWDSRKDIEEFALIHNYQGDVKKITNTHIKESKGEKICRNYLEKKFKVRFRKMRPEFLKNPVTNMNLELDCFSPELAIAVEYNGRQHYEHVPKFHKTYDDFTKQKYRDVIKKMLCKKQGITLIEVPYTVQHKDIPRFLENELYKCGKNK
nr:MAG: putative uyr/REP helicase [Diabrotica toursvirus 3a]